MEDGDETGNIFAYYSFCMHAGMGNSGYSNSMDFDDFVKAYNFYSFDLTGTGESFDPDLEPACRVGYYRLQTTFSGNLPVNLNCLIISEFPSCLTLSKNGIIS